MKLPVAANLIQTISCLIHRGKYNFQTSITIDCDVCQHLYGRQKLLTSSVNV